MNAINKKVVRNRILARAGNKCERCHVPNNATVCRGRMDGCDVWQDDDGNIHDADTGEYYGSNYVGEVWHEKDYGLVTISLAIVHIDNDSTNLEESNIKALCQHCRAKHQNIREKQRNTRNKNKGLQSLF